MQNVCGCKKSSKGLRTLRPILWNVNRNYIEPTQNKRWCLQCLKPYITELTISNSSILSDTLRTTLCNIFQMQHALFQTSSAEHGLAPIKEHWPSTILWSRGTPFKCQLWCPPWILTATRVVEKHTSLSELWNYLKWFCL